ncbi:mrps-31, partial [Pristionchus pacificus]|uniref:Small ribosomal subunit protein mS31 n=1 Tax=Pristionchus pacificus TaxID=54126 RepID=A0A8R1Z647_PRIPA
SMLLRTIGGLVRSGLSNGGRRGVRALSVQTGGDGKEDHGKKDVNPKEVLDEEILKAVDDVANELGGDKEKKKGLRTSLLSRLISHEKETFQSATVDHTSEMFSDPGVLAVLKEAAAPTKPLPNAIHDRKAKRGLVLLRKEVFYQAVQSGYSAEDAQRISMEAVEEAEKRVEEKRDGEIEKRKSGDIEKKVIMEKREEKEQKLFDMAYDLAQKMLYGDDAPEQKLAALASKVLEADPSFPSFFDTKTRLNIFKGDISQLETRRIGFWEEWEERAAKTWNQSIGPENAFEEQILWTKKGAQWPYPINNEYLLGQEEKVPFFEHIFVDRRLASSNLPKEETSLGRGSGSSYSVSKGLIDTDGPIAHFMHLVAVGLSKNPHMTVEKKQRHIDWFISFFNVEKQKLVHKLHEQEQAAAAAS